MSVQRTKDLSRLVARTRIRAKGTPHFWDVFLWPDRRTMRANTGEKDPLAAALHQAVPVLADPESGDLLPRRKMGEVHFCRGSWDMEVVAHELMHAVFWRLATLCPSCLAILRDGDMSKEEEVCYDFGRWVQHVYKFLWQHDQPKGWERKEAGAL